MLIYIFTCNVVLEKVQSQKNCGVHQTASIFGLSSITFNQYRIPLFSSGAVLILFQIILRDEDDCRVKLNFLFICIAANTF